MAKVEKDPFRCSECGWGSQKWVGRCGECQDWGSVEELAAPKKLSLVPGKVTHAATPIGDVDLSSARARATGVSELDRVLGGGLVPGAAILLAGEPGVGKSTLLLSVAAQTAAKGIPALYISGEESASQVRLRAERINAVDPKLFLASETDLGAVWHFGDMLREYRGDSHTAAWISAGLDATEIGLLTELFWGLPLKSYSRTRAWSEDDYTAAIDRLESRGLIAEGAFTDKGRQLREQVEINTDEQMRQVISAIGENFYLLIAMLQPWSQFVQNFKGYPGSGPHELAEAASRR